MADVYGLDVSTFPLEGGVDIDPLMPTISGERAAIEGCVRRLMTPRGSLGRSAPDYGYDLSSKLGARLSPVTRQRIALDIESELGRDERVFRARVTEFSDQGAGSWRIRIRVELATGPFTLTIAASAVTLALLAADKG